MAASASDYFKQVARRWVGQIGSGGVSDASVTTIPLSATTNLPTGTGVVVVIDRVDSNGNATASKEETINGVVSGSNLISCTRGVEGTAQAHDAGAVVEVLVTASLLNDIVTGILIQHDQAGRHTNITACNVTASGTATLSHIVASEVTAREVRPPSGAPTKISAQYGSVQADSITSSQAILDLAVARSHQVTLASGVTTSLVASNVQVGQVFDVRLVQPSAGSSGVVSWLPGSTIKWAGGVAPTLTTTNSKADWIGLRCTSASNFDGVVIGQNI